MSDGPVTDNESVLTPTLRDELFAQVKLLYGVGKSLHECEELIKDYDKFIKGAFKDFPDLKGTIHKMFEKLDNHVTDNDNNNKSTLTPTLYDKLFEAVKKRYKLKKTLRSMEKEKADKRDEIIREFKDFPDLEETIDNMLEEIRIDDDYNEEKDDAQEETHREKKDDALEQIVNDGREDALKAAHREKKDDEKTSSEHTLASKFVYSDVTSEIYDQRNLSIYKRAVNIARSTGEMVDLEDKEIVEMRNSYADNYISRLPESSVEKLQKLYGDNWEKVIRDAYESGFKMGTKVCMEQATKEGMDLRKQDEEIVSKNGTFQSSKEKIDLEELKFCYERFSYRPNESGTDVIDKDGRVINNSRTKNMYWFAFQWVAALGEETAFTEKGKQLYSLIQNQSQQDLEKNGIIDVETLKSYADDLGDNGEVFSKIITSLFKNDTTTRLMDSYFRMQTPNAIPYPPVSKESEEEKTSSK